MIDSTDFTMPGTGVLKNKLGITDPAALSRAATELDGSSPCRASGDACSRRL